MRLDELRQTIIASDIEDWDFIAGPSYLDRFLPGHVRHGESDEMVYELQHDGQHSRAIYEPDVDISIAWGMDVNPDDRQLSEEWTQKFADKSAHQLYADVFYRGSIVDRLILVNVDGGRYNIALPTQDFDESDDTPKVIGLHVSPWQDAIGRLTTDLSSGHQYRGAFNRTGIELR